MESKEHSDSQKEQDQRMYASNLAIRRNPTGEDIADAKARVDENEK